MSQTIEQRRASQRARQAEYRKKYPERVRASKKAYVKAHRAEENARHKSWRDRNGEKRRAVCRRATAVYRRKHPEKVNEWARKNPERYRAAVTAWGVVHREELRVLVSAWMKAHPEKVREYGRRWRNENPERVRAIRHRRRARAVASPGAFTKEDVVECLLIQGRRCFYCLASLASGYHVEHMTPLCRGGSNGPENIVCSCEKCNLQKGNKTAAEFILKEAA